MNTRLSEFDDLLARGEYADRLLQRISESGQQLRIGAIRHAHPDELHRDSGPQNQAEKIFVLADDHARFVRGLSANLGVRRLRHADVEDMNCIVALRVEPAREGFRQLIIDEKPHVAWRTT